jgi:hypothetical protein
MDRFSGNDDSIFSLNDYNREQSEQEDSKAAQEDWFVIRAQTFIGI